MLVSYQRSLDPVKAISLHGITILAESSVVSLSMVDVLVMRINLKPEKNARNFVSLLMIWVN